MRGPSADRRTVLLGLAATSLPSFANAAQEPVWRWGVDYGAATDAKLARTFDLLVLEPDHDRPIEPLRGPGSQLLGYISLGEVEKRRPFVSRLEKAGALRKPNPNWPDARLIDLRHDAWKSLVVGELVPAILAKGFDGIFMDTLDNAEAMQVKDPAGSAGMVDAGADLVGAIRKHFPQISIMMNRGYALLPRAAPHINLLLGEAMASRWSFRDRKYEFAPPEDWAWQAERLRAAQRANPAIVLTTLDYWDPSDTATVASLYARERAAGFRPYVATLALDRLWPEPKP